MTKEELLKTYGSLSDKERSELDRFITKLQKQHVEQRPKKKLRSFRDEPFFGMWKDREDMKEGGAAWVRKLRSGPHWNRLKRDNDSR
jgi:hypothetical protein